MQPLLHPDLILTNFLPADQQEGPAMYPCWPLSLNTYAVAVLRAVTCGESFFLVDCEDHARVLLSSE